MGFRVTGLDPAALVGLTEQGHPAFADAYVERVVADGKPGYACRLTLEDAEAGETLLLFHHVSHDVKTPYRAAYAIYVREAALKSATETTTETVAYHNALPPFWDGRGQSLRAFDGEGMLLTGVIAQAGEIAEVIETLFADDEVAYLHAHNPAYGCYMARVERAG